MLDAETMSGMLAQAGSTDPAAKPTKRPVVLITTVDIGGGKSDKIELRKGDEPADAAREFCTKHKLPPSIIGPLTQHILENMAKAKQTAEAQKAARQNATKDEQDVPAVSDSEGARHQQAEREQPQPQQQVAAPPAQPAAPELPQEKLTFANGMNDRLYEQLSAKLMPVDDSSRVLTVSATNTGPLLSNRAGSVRNSSIMSSERQHRVSRSADPSPRDSVFCRLYSNAIEVRTKQDAKRKMQAAEMTASMHQGRSSMSWISQEMMRDRTHGPFENYGEMLYAEGLEQAALRRSKAMQIKAEREAKELEGATFAPEITRLAKALWSGGDLESQPAWQRLSQVKRDKTLALVREMQRAREETELRECTFRPRINRTSAALMADRSEALKTLQVSHHEQLFQDALRRQAKMKELQSWVPEEATFHPAVNKSSQAALYLRRSYETMGLSTGAESARSGNDGASVADSVRAASVVDRLYLAHEKTKAKLEEARERINGPVDPNTGRHLYRPEVGRGPKNVARNRDGMAIGEYLYVNGLEYLSRKEAQLEAERRAEADRANLRHSTATSQKLFERLKTKRFSQIFEYLDEAGSGLLDVVALVRAPTAHMDNLDAEVREDVELAASIHAANNNIPLLPPDHLGAAMADAGVSPSAAMHSAEALAALPPAPPVDLAAFSTLLEQALLKRRKPRAYLVPSPTSKYSPNHSFKPNINKRSKEMAARLRPQELALHEILHHNAEAVRAKLEQMRKETEEAELKECTFAPKLNTAAAVNGRPAEGKALRKAGVSGSVSLQGSRVWSATTSLAASPRPGHASGEGPHGAVSQPQAGSGSDAEMQQFMALEREMQEALAGVNQAQERLSGLQGSNDGQQAAAGNEGEDMINAAERLRAQLDGAGIDPTDLRATEELLLDLLTHSDGSDPATDADVLNQIHRILVQSQQAASQEAGAELAGAGAQAHVTTTATSATASSKRSGKEGAAQMFVVPAAAGPNNARASMQDLASTLAGWDPLNDPSMASVQ